MIKYHYTENKKIIAELIDVNFVISQIQDALDLMGKIGSHDCNRIIIHEINLHEDFFYLKTGFAGEILQKFSNYNVKLAIIGDFLKYESKSLQDFIRESNKRNIISFVNNLDSALIRLEK
jgi:hypothetical protein